MEIVALIVFSFLVGANVGLSFGMWWMKRLYKPLIEDLKESSKWWYEYSRKRS
jgi:hypothetical protein